MNHCIFCTIIRKKAPCYKVYEDNEFLAFLDIMPLNHGHTLLIPKKHYRWVYDVPNFGGYWEIARKIGFKIQKAMSASSISYLTVGEQVPHAHIHIIPRYTQNDDILGLKNFKKIEPDEMKRIADILLN